MYYYQIFFFWDDPLSVLQSELLLEMALTWWSIIYLFTGIKTHNLVRKFIKIQPAFLSWKGKAKLHSDRLNLLPVNIENTGWQTVNLQVFILYNLRDMPSIWTWPVAYVFSMNLLLGVQNCISSLVVNNSFCRESPNLMWFCLITYSSFHFSKFSMSHLLFKAVFCCQRTHLFRQMAISAGFERVFEVGPVFRANNKL